MGRKRVKTTAVVISLSLSGRANGFSLPTMKSVARVISQAHESLPRAQVEQIRCPFWRRRATEALEGCEAVLRFIAARHKSLALPPVLLNEAFFEEAQEREHKGRVRSVETIAQEIEDQFVRKNYYVTGRLDLSMYTERAFFNAPDPDMPCYGPAKFADALSGLFYGPRSQCDLLDIRILDADTIQALWRLEGVLRLPWRPTIKSFVGETTYYLNDDGLIQAHIEEWSIPVIDAFLSALVDDNFASSLRPPPAPSTQELGHDLETARSLIIRDKRQHLGSAYLPMKKGNERKTKAEPTFIDDNALVC